MVLAGEDELAEEATRVEAGRVVVVQATESHENGCDEFGAEESFEVCAGEKLSALEHASAGEQSPADVIADVSFDEVIEKDAREEFVFGFAETIDLRQSVHIDSSTSVNVVTHAVDGTMSLYACDRSLSDEAGVRAKCRGLDPHSLLFTLTTDGDVRWGPAKVAWSEE